ncbi:MAG: hypothetical protein WC455_15260 [Dehalococcoidia bacterium]|jgi:hypothetical protein
MSEPKEPKESLVDPSAVAEVFGPDPMQHAMADTGITSESIAKRLKAQLNAKETKFFQHEGVVVETRDVIAWAIRQRATDMALKLMGAYPAEKQKHEFDTPLIVEIRKLAEDAEDKPTE